MEFFFYMECALCEGDADLGPVETPEEIGKQAEAFARTHQCKPQPTRDDVIRWAGGGS